MAEQRDRRLQGSTSLSNCMGLTATAS